MSTAGDTDVRGGDVSDLTRDVKAASEGVLGDGGPTPKVRCHDGNVHQRRGAKGKTFTTS